MAVKLIRSLKNIDKNAQGGVVTIGNFDGVHLGHQALLAETIAAAKSRRVCSVIVTFEPHPSEYFAGENVKVPRLTRLREKFLALSKTGVDYVVILTFNQILANISASDFITEILHHYLKACHVMVGDDFHFGKERKGNLQLLQALGPKNGFTVQAMPTYVLGNERVSSTRIRAALAAGDHILAEQLLGRRYSMQGRVRSGDQLGRQLGFPTANIFLHRKLTPVHGIYTVLMHGITEKPLPGVANVGTRPTVDGTKTLLEVHLLNFNDDIYGRYVQVDFCEKLRDEERYATLDLLKDQIAKDVLAARNYFNMNGAI